MYNKVNFGSPDERPTIFIKGKPVLSSERALHKDFDRKNSVEKKNISLVVSLKVPDAKPNRQS
jgi:hypothetical protein